MNRDGLERCEQAFLRLKNRKPEHQEFKGQLITPSLVSKEAGFDAGYLKFSRSAHRSLLNQIDIHKNNHKSGGLQTKVASLERDIKKLKIDKEQYKKQRDDSLIRELILFEQLSQLQDRKKNHNIFSLKNA
jgi:hypothetical protein